MNFSSQSNYAIGHRAVVPPYNPHRSCDQIFATDYFPDLAGWPALVPISIESRCDMLKFFLFQNGYTSLQENQKPKFKDCFID